MTNLSPAQVLARAGAAGLPLSNENLAEVTHRLSDFIESLAPAARSVAGRSGAPAAAAGASVTPVSDADLGYRDATELPALVRVKQVPPVELVRVYLYRIERLDGSLRAFIRVFGDEALAAARRAEATVQAGGLLGPLHGVRLTVKDQFDVQGVPTTMGYPRAGDRVLPPPPACRLNPSGRTPWLTC